MGSIESVPAAFQLTVSGGRGLLSFHSTVTTPLSAVRPVEGWAEIQELELGVEITRHPALPPAVGGDGENGATASLQNRRLRLRKATVGTSAARLQRSLDACPLGDLGVQDARLSLGPGGPWLVGRFAVGNREAPFTIRIAIDPRADGRRRLRVTFADVRLFAHLPLPAPLVGAAIASAIVTGTGRESPLLRARGSMIDVDPLEIVLIQQLVAQGWRLPDIANGWLESVETMGDQVRLAFASEGHPTERLATLEQDSAIPLLACLEGERLPETLAAAEHHLIAGDQVAAEAAYRRACDDAPDHPAAWARLLALRTASGASDAVEISAVMIARWPDFLPGFLGGAIAALETGDAARAAALFDGAATLAEGRGEIEDAALARAAAESARKRGASSPVVGPWSVANAGPAGTALADLAGLTDLAISRGNLDEADALFAQRLAMARSAEESALLTADRARVQLLGPEGTLTGLATLRGIALVLTPEEGLVLRADLEERVGDLADARQTLAELVTRAVAAGDMTRARELSAHSAELSVPNLDVPIEDAIKDAIEDTIDAQIGDPGARTPNGDRDAAPGIPRRVEPGDSGQITARTEAVYAEKSDPDLRAEALGTLLRDFEQLAPDRQHAAYASFGRVAESTGDLEHAEEAYWRAATFQGDPARRANDLMAHARVLLSRGNVAAAVTELEQALALAPEHVGTLALLADQSFHSRDEDRARALYARLDATANATEAITREMLVLRRAVLARGMGDANEAEIFYRELAILNPSHIESRRELAQIALERYDLRTAANRLEEVLRLLPIDALDALLDVRQNLGEICVGLSDWEAARYYVELVLAQDPGRLATMERLAEIYEHLGLHAAAADVCDQLARLYPQPRKRAECLFREGEILQDRLDDEARAFDAFLKSSDLDPTFTPTALRLVAGYWNRGQFNDTADVGDDLRRAGPLPAMEPALRLRLALATALTRGDASRSCAEADLSSAPWNADIAARALADVAAHLAARPPNDLEPANAVLDAWRGYGREELPVNETTDWLWGALRALVSKDPADPGAARALGWLADRRADVILARGFFSTAVFLDKNDGAAGRLEEMGPAPAPTAAVLALGGPVDHADAVGTAAPLRRALEALARGLAGFGPPAASILRTPMGDLPLGADQRDALYALAKSLGPPALALGMGMPKPGAEANGDAPATDLTVVATRPARIEIPPALMRIPDAELTFLVARAFDRLRNGMALIDAATTGAAVEVTSLLRGARAALTGGPAPEEQRANAVALELGGPGRAAELVGASDKERVIADLDKGLDVLPRWNAFRTAIDRAGDRFAVLACRSPLAALRALYRADTTRAPAIDEPSERARRVAFLRTNRVRDLLRFVRSAEYVHALNDAQPPAPADADFKA